MKASLLIIIPTLNEARTIGRVLDELSTNLPETIRVHFVVTDGGSSDGTIEIVQRIASLRPDLSLVRNGGRFQSAGVNLAVRRFGRGFEFLVRCDAHASYPAGYIRKLLGTAQCYSCDSVVVAMDSVGTTAVQKAIAWVSDTKLGSGGSAHRGGARSGYVDHGHHALIRMASFLEVGGYDETFTHNEDAEFDCRLRASGGRIYLDGAIRLKYQPRSNFAALWRQYYHYGRGRSRTAKRHPHSLRARQVAVPAYLLLCLASALAFPFAPFLSAPLIAYLAVLLASSVVIAFRERSLAGLLAGPAGLVMHIAWASGFIRGLATIPVAPHSPHLGSSNATIR